MKNIETALADEMRTVVAAQRCTKKTAARLAVSNIIQAGILAPGDYLPSEQALTRILGVSLGTVQGALRQLQDIGAIVRRRGDGTRVTEGEPHSDRVWHFRFLSKEDGTPLRLGVEEVWQKDVEGEGYWSAFLGGGSGRCLCICRRIVTRGGVRSGAEMLVPARLADRLAPLQISELRMINIRPYLEAELGLTVVDRDHIVKTVTPSAAERKTFDLRTAGPHYEIHAMTRAGDGQPVYYQRILVAVADCDLNF